MPSLDTAFLKDMRPRDKIPVVNLNVVLVCANLLEFFF